MLHGTTSPPPSSISGMSVSIGQQTHHMYADEYYAYVSSHELRGGLLENKILSFFAALALFPMKVCHGTLGNLFRRRVDC